MANSSITRKAIQTAFLDILNEKPLSRITVREISDRCGINRNTFYYHYQDVLDLLEEFFEEECDRIVQQYPTINSIEECLEAAMNFAQSNSRAITHIFQSDSSDIYSTSLWRICDYVITNYAMTVFPDAPVAREDMDLFIRYHKCACYGMITDWINSGMKQEYVDGLKRICELMKGASELIISNASGSADSK